MNRRRQLTSYRGHFGVDVVRVDYSKRIGGLHRAAAASSVVMDGAD